MTEKIEPYLLIKRLVVVGHNSMKRYDELFHTGVNIIAGDNSSGKSTILNFIFFGLGGDFTDWNTEAVSCREVFLEVSFNGRIVTLNREVSDVSMRPLSIYYGTYLESSKSRTEGWQIYPYKQSTNKESYSNVIFNLIGYPEVRSVEDNNITVHQILRLLYIDQNTPSQNLFRFENFDIPLTRLATAELLLGVYDDTLYDDRLRLKSFQKKLGEVKSRLATIKNAFKITGALITESEIEKRYKKLTSNLEKIEKKIASLRVKSNLVRRSNSPVETEVLQKELKSIKSEFYKQLNLKDSLDDDINDSSLFIESLESRRKSLNDSLIVRNSLGLLELKYCPSCLKPIDTHNEQNICKLCKQPITEKEKSRGARVIQELTLQIRESKKLLDKKKIDFSNVKLKANTLRDKLVLRQKEYDKLINSTSSTRDQNLDSLLTEKGGLINDIESLDEQRNSIKLLRELESELGDISKKISELSSQIFRKETAQQKTFGEGLKAISNYAKTILKNDLDRQSEFANPKILDVDFRKDSYSLDGSNNFSASSNTLLKNSIRFAVFFASLSQKKFRFPRFILCDNIEDNGMEDIRSKNFQKVLVELSKSSNVQHQIIYSTSMLNTEIENIDDLIVGKKHSSLSRSLS